MTNQKGNRKEAYKKSNEGNLTYPEYSNRKNDESADKTFNNSMHQQW